MEDVVLDINIYTHAVGSRPCKSWDPSVLDSPSFVRSALAAYQSEAMILLALVARVKNGVNTHAVHANEHVFTHVQSWLSTPVELKGYGWSDEAAADYVSWLKDFILSTGGSIDTPVEDDPNVLAGIVTDKQLRSAGIEKDTEDARVIALARDTGSTVIATDDSKFRKLSPWRGIITIESPQDFVRRLV